MIEKNEQMDDTDSNLSRIKLIANKRKFLENNSIQIQEEIKSCFAQLAETLQFREKQLLRQAEAVRTQQLSLVQSSIEFLPSFIVNLKEKQKLEEQIRNFGEIELSETNCITVKDIEPYKVVEYQEANKDHISFNKSIKYENNFDASEKQLNSNEINELNALVDYMHICNNCSDVNFDDDENLIVDNETNSISQESELTKINTITDKQNFEVIPSGSSSLTIKQDSSACFLSNKQSKLKRKCFNDLKIISTSNLDTDTVPNRVISEKMNIEPKKHDDSLDRCEADTYALDNFHHQENSLDESKSIETTKSQDILKDAYEQPKQIQQWLQQILVETEIEPTIHETEQFSEISEVQLYNQFQLET